MLLNSSVQPGDVLILTKPIGVGIVMTAAQGDMIGDVALQEAYRYMSQLNKEAPSIMSRFTVHSCTDVTGFGLIGHAFEMARGSGYTIHLESTCVPLYDDAIPMASMGFVPAGAYRNRDFTDGNVRLPTYLLRCRMYSLTPRHQVACLLQYQKRKAPFS